MDALRRNILKNAGGVGAIGLAIGAGLLKPTLALADWNKAAFDAKTVPEAVKVLGVANAAESKDIVIKAPDIAENGVVVPVEVTSNIPGTEYIMVLAENNPTPLIADFDLTNGAMGYVAIRIKMGKTGPVRAIVKANGKLYTAFKQVKVTIGGCGG